MPRLMEAMLCCKEPLRTGSGFKGIIIHLLTRSGTVQRDLLARGSGRGRVAGGRAAGGRLARNSWECSVAVGGGGLRTWSTKRRSEAVAASDQR